MGALAKYKNIFLIGVIVVLAFIGFTVFTREDDDAALTSTTQEASALIAGRELLAILIELKAIDLDDSIFEDPVFRSLEDFSQELIPQPTGRRNPFAPITVEQGDN